MSVKSATDAEAVGIDEDAVKLEQEVLSDTQAPSRERDVDYDSDTPPTPEEWKTMKGYGSFISKSRRSLQLISIFEDFSLNTKPTTRLM